MTQTQPESTPISSPPRVAVSLVAPMRNESSYVEDLVRDLAAQDIEEPFEVIVADGGSTDGSPGLLRSAAEKAGLDLILVDNPEGHASPGLNRCIRAASGDVIVRLDCHTRYPADYVRRCVEAVRETGAANVAGVFTAIGRTPTERAIACALDSPFGGHNWTRNLDAGGRVEVDTNYLGAFPKEALDGVGMYDEDLVVGEVEDLNLSLRKAGGIVLLDPRIHSYYYPRGSFGSLFHQYYRYGYWKVAVIAKHRQVISGRASFRASSYSRSLALGSRGSQAATRGGCSERRSPSIRSARSPSELPPSASAASRRRCFHGSRRRSRYSTSRTAPGWCTGSSTGSSAGAPRSEHDLSRRSDSDRCTAARAASARRGPPP